MIIKTIAIPDFQTKKLATSVIWLLLAVSFVNAKANDVPRQNENIIANYSLNEDDTMRYSNHYLFERAYNVIGDMLTDKRLCMWIQMVKK